MKCCGLVPRQQGVDRKDYLGSCVSTTTEGTEAAGQISRHRRTKRLAIMHLLSSAHCFLDSLPFLHSASTQKRGLHRCYKRFDIVFEADQSSTNKILVPLQSEKMIVSITGATGFIGRKLVARLLSDGHKVRILTRSVSNARNTFPVKRYPSLEIGEEPDWGNFIQGSTAVVNLAGTPISTRWTPEVKEDILNSRVQATKRVVEAINWTTKELRPSVLVNATAVGFYGTSNSDSFDESSSSGRDYLSKVCTEWEQTAKTVDDSVRLVLLRIGIVLDNDGGALAQMIPLFKLFAGGPIGSGKQWFSWIHRDDLVNLIIEALSNDSYKGAINGTAPNPVRFQEMCDQLGAALGRPSWLPVPDFVLQALLGEGANLVLQGQRVLPKRALDLGFKFKYRYISDALKEIVAS